jgi:hypothetical protein
VDVSDIWCNRLLFPFLILFEHCVMMSMLCNCCVRELLILARTWFAFGLPSKTGCDSYEGPSGWIVQWTGFTVFGFWTMVWLLFYVYCIGHKLNNITMALICLLGMCMWVATGVKRYETTNIKNSSLVTLVYVCHPMRGGLSQHKKLLSALKIVAYADCF